MINSRYTRPVLPLALATALVACGGGADAPADEANGGETVAEEGSVIETRQANFESIGDDFKAIRGQLETSEPDFGVIEASANSINTNAQKISGYFPEGTGVDSGADTEALETIWEKPEEFAAAAQKLVDTSASLAAVAGSGDAAAVGEAVKAMGGSCKACHDNFRLDKD